jgi:response regulator RpfG family c-di-GMP phosphodiesterase
MPDEETSSWERNTTMTSSDRTAAAHHPNKIDKVTAPDSASIRVLIVDDQLSARKVLQAMLAPCAGCIAAESGEEALRILQTERVDAVISDLTMPGTSGMQLLVAARRLYRDLPFLLATGVDETRIGIEAMRQGADDYLVKPFDVETVVMSLNRALEKKSLEREVASYRLRLEEMVSERTQQLQTALQLTARGYEDTLEVLGAAIDLRDSPTAGHSRRVFLYSMEIARRMADVEHRLKHVAMGAWLHDIGKLAIPDRILLKPGPLTKEEWVVMRTHARIGYDLVKSIAFLADAAEIVHTHHERYDGSGYPEGLKAEQIPVGARVFAVADTLDAMTSDRPYHAARSFQAAREEIERGAGRHYDPRVVKTFLNISNEAWETIGRQTASVKASSIVRAETVILPEETITSQG